MAVPFSNTKLRVPKGFQNILECLAREVLRSQPDNLHEFAAAYFEKLMKVRSETGHDPAIHGAKLEDRNYNNESFKKRTIDSSDPQQNQAATSIQTQFRQHSAKQEVETMKEELAATRIQAGVRGYLDREQVRDMKTKQDGGEQEEEVDIDLEDPDVEKAAIKIQAGFKGFKARKDIQKQSEASSSPQPEEAEATAEPEAAQTTTTSEAAPGGGEEEIDIDLNDPDTEKAALKIQAGFRGYQTRKDLQTKDNEQPKESQPTQEPEAAGTTEAPAEGEAAKVEEEEEIDIDLTDPEVEKAATKIQAGFKGFKARKEVQSMKAIETDGSDKVDARPEVSQPVDESDVAVTSSGETGGAGEIQTDTAVPAEVATDACDVPDFEVQTESSPAEAEAVTEGVEEPAPVVDEGGN